MIFFQNATFRAKKLFVCPPFPPQYAPLSHKSSKTLTHSAPLTQNSTQDRPIPPHLQINVKAVQWKNTGGLKQKHKENSLLAKNQSSEIRLSESANKNKNLKNSLGAKWSASHLAVRLCALRHWKRVSMPPTTQSLRHPLTRAIHLAPRIKTARRFTAKTP